MNNMIKDIWNKLKVDFTYLTGYDYSGLIKSIGAGFASRLAEFNSKLNFIQKQAFVATADKEYLYLHTGKMLPPLPAQSATGGVVFYGESGSVVDIGTQITDGTNTYKTMAQAEISERLMNGNVSVVGDTAYMEYQGHNLTDCIALINGLSKKITVVDENNLKFEAGDILDTQVVVIQVKCSSPIFCVCNEAGIDTNRELNSVLKLKTTISGVNKEVGVLKLDGGKAEEQVEDYRKRVEYFIRNPIAPFNNNHIKKVCLDYVKSLKYVWVKRPQDGKVQVIAMNNDFGLNSLEADQTKEATLSIAPANLDNSHILEVVAPTINNKEVIISSLVPNSDGLRKAIEKNIEYVFNGDMYEKGVSKEKLEAVIYKTTNGGEEVESFTLTSGWQDAQDNVFLKYEKTTFN